MSLPDRFELRRRLGEGGFGIVFEVFDRDTQRRVALKMLRAEAVEARAQLKAEFRVLQDVAHPNLVTLGELGDHDGALYFTMDVVDGVDFLAWTRHSIDRLRDAFAQLADGLAALHAARLVHRDIKPENALVRTDDARVVLLDFGLVTAETRVPQTGEHVIGTPVYMAPEQLLGAAVGAPADCYAAGVMLYEALAGHPPFVGSAAEIAMRKAVATPPPLGGDVPADLAELCRALLASEPAARPTATDILAALGRAPTRIVTLPPAARASGTAQPRSVFMGRADEMHRLVAQLAAVRRGETRAVILRGESGIGKTALARRFVDDRMSRGVVLWSRCYERETAPFKAVDGLIDGLTRAVDGTATAAALGPEVGSSVMQMFPALGRAMRATPAHHGTAREIRARAFEAVRTLLGRLARAYPLAIVIDDLQWTDRDSLALLAHVLAPPDAPPLLFVGCVRDDAAAAAREEALRGLAVELHEIQLGPLDGESAALLAKHVLGNAGVDPRVVAREAAGHPLFTMALAHNLTESGPAGASARTLGDVFAGRLARLSDGARRIAAVVCVAAAPMPIGALAAAAGVADVQDAVSTLRVAQLVRTSGPGEHDLIEPFHDRVRAAIAGALGDGERRELHASIARALEAAGAGDPAVLALHWAHGGDTAAAARHARLAADRALDVLAFERAAGLLRWLLELDPEAADRGTLLVKLGDAFAGAGRVADVADAYLEAARVPGSDSVMLRRRAMHQLFLAGHIQRALDLMAELAAELGLANPGGPRTTLLNVAVQRARIAMHAGKPRPATDRDRARIDFCFDAGTGLALIDSVRALLYQSTNLALSQRSDDPSRLARALMADAVYHATRGPSPRLERHLARCDQLGAELGGNAAGWALVARGMASTALGRWRVAAECLEACERQIGEAPSRVADGGVSYTWLLDSTRTMRGGPLMFLGRLRELRRFTATNLRDALDRNDLVAATYLRTGTQTLFWLTAGDVEAATRHADEGLAPWAGNSGHLPALMDLQARTSIDLYRGDGASAIERVRTSWPAFRASLLMQVQYARITLLDVRGRSAVAAGAAAPASERKPLLAEAERSAAKLAGQDGVWSRPLADTIRAGAAAVRGDATEASAALERALAGYEAADMTLHAETHRLVHALRAGAGARDQLRAAQLWLGREGVVAPERLARVIAPGLLA